METAFYTTRKPLQQYLPQARPLVAARETGHTGNCYYSIGYLHQPHFIFISPEIQSLLGYEPITVNRLFLHTIVHPDDQQWVLQSEQVIKRFFNPLTTAQAIRYKAQYDYRVRRADGNYIRLLHQLLIMEADATGPFIKTLCLHTDISQFKKEGMPALSFIGSDGAPSYPNINVTPGTACGEERLTRRETEILTLLQEGRDSKEIADRLYIARTTVDTHRKNMLKKAGVPSTTKLIAMALKKGWL